MLDGGRLLRSAPLDPPSDGTAVSVEVFGDPRPLVAALTAKGVEVTYAGPVVTARSSSEDVFIAVRDALAASGSSVRRMGTDLRSLEDVFVAATKQSNG